MNGDTFYTDAVYTKVNELFSTVKEGIFLLCSRVDEVETDDVKIKFNDRNKIIEAAKNIKNYDGVSAGLMIVIGDNSSTVFRQALDKVSRRDDFLSHKKTWHSFIKDLADENIDIEPLMVDKSEWSEIDIHYDLHKLQRLL